MCKLSLVFQAALTALTALSEMGLDSVTAQNSNKE